MTNKKSFTLLMLMAVFVVPVLISWLLFYYHDLFQFKTTNRGTLITPAIFVAGFQLGSDSKKWQIVYAPQDCSGSHFEKVTFTLHQLRQALGKDYKRVVLTLLVGKNCQIEDAHDFRLLQLDAQQLLVWQEKFQQPGFDVWGKIYLVDPMNNLFMYYPSDVDAMSILKDMKKVLEVSQIG